MKLTESQVEEFIMLIHLELLSLGASPRRIVDKNNEKKLKYLVTNSTNYWFDCLSMCRRFFDFAISELELEQSMARLTRNYILGAAK